MDSPSYVSLKLISSLIIVECREFMFVHECGIKADRMQLQSMRPRGWVDEGVIDCWAMLLNHEELARDRNSPNRLFCPKSVTTSDMILNRKISLKEKGEMLNENLKPFFKIGGMVKHISNYDLVLMPVCVGYHYFLISFDLKNPSVSIVDNVAGQPNESPIIDIHIFVSFLQISGHPKAMQFISSEPIRMPLKWCSETNLDDSSIFLMRHMETFKGSRGPYFDSGFSVDPHAQVTQILKLRFKYTAKLILSKVNKLKGKVVPNAMKVAKG